MRSASGLDLNFRLNVGDHSNPCYVAAYHSPPPLKVCGNGKGPPCKVTLSSPPQAPKFLRYPYQKY